MSRPTPRATETRTMPLYGSTQHDDGPSTSTSTLANSDMLTKDTSLTDLTNTARASSSASDINSHPDQQQRTTSLLELSNNEYTTCASSNDTSSHPERHTTFLDHFSNEQTGRYHNEGDTTDALLQAGVSGRKFGEISRRNSIAVCSRRERHASVLSGDGQLDLESSFVVLVAENSIEAQRINNNYKFGLKKWKSHVTSRPIDVRSEIVQDLYSDINNVKDIKVKTLRPFNVIYTVLFGWWLCLLYGIIGVFMFVSVVGIPYANFCWSFAAYFFWPFGKFVHQVKPYRNSYSTKELTNPAIPPDSSCPNSPDGGDKETTYLVKTRPSVSYDDVNQTEKKTFRRKCMEFWTKPATWVWAILGLLPLLLVHFVVFFVSWLFVISIPTAKLNGKMLTKILFLPPREIVIRDTEMNFVTMDGSNSKNSEILMYTHQSINFYYYKYTIDGVNIILANSLIFVVLSIVIGYSMDIEPVVKCVLGVLAIIPLTYYIGMAITSVAAQSSFAVGALLNATFGSAVEVILMIVMLLEGVDSGKECYQELVKSSLTGSILCSILFIPGMSMVVGGLKYPTQKFNPKSANVSSTLLFLAVAGVFSPTILNSVFGQVECHECYIQGMGTNGNWTYFAKDSVHDVQCQRCASALIDPDHSSTYRDHIRHLVYGVCIVLPIAYLIGVVFTMKTHSVHVFADFEKQLREENEGKGHGIAQWSRAKSVVILLMCAVCIALCGDLISDNIKPLLEATGVSEYFVGVTMLSLVSELPEVVNGVQFALQNNVNLGIEIGCSTAVQVCLIQIPLLVLANLIHDMNFFLVFNFIHLIAVVFSIVVINYIFSDGKSDYFQGAIVVIIYILLMLMYLFMPTPDHVKC